MCLPCPFATLLLLGCLALTGLVAQGQTRPTAWAFQNWKIEDGLPDNNVSAICQMPEGELLVATYGGLVRFDGLRMTQPELYPGTQHGNGRGSLVRGMLLAKDGSRWLATGQGRLVHSRAGRSTLYNPAHGLNSYPLHLSEDASGALWVSYSEGEVVRIAEGGISIPGEQQGLPPQRVAKFALDRQGDFWAATDEKLLRYDGSGFRAEAELLATPNWRRTTAICPAADGGLWLSAGLTLYKKLRNQPPQVVAQIPEDGQNTSVSRLLEDRSGRLWACLYDGNVYCLDKGDLTRAGSTMHEVTAVTDDQEGNLWLGASEGGLWRVRPRVLETLAVADPLVNEALCSTAQDLAGNIWATGTNGFLFKRAQGRWQHLTAAQGWHPAEARTVSAAPTGGVWIGTKDDGVYEATPAGGFRHLPFPSAPPWGNIRAMMTSRDGTLWTAVNADLWHWNSRAWTHYPSPPGEGYIQTLAEDGRGVVWAGTSEGQLLTVRGGQLKDQRPSHLGDAAVRGLLVTPDGALWIGRATEGLLRLDPNHPVWGHVVGPEQGLDRSGISHLVLDDQGRLWGGSSQGLFSVPLEDLTAAAAGSRNQVRLSSYGKDEGLPSLQSARGYWPNTLRDTEGRLWFNLRTGTIIAHPEAAGNNPVPPPVSIESVRWDGNTLSGVNLSKLELPPYHRTLEINFAAMSFRSPQNVRLKHQLVGLDPTWVDSSAERHAVYSRLPAGDYLFRVMGANDSGIWNATGASMTITVRPFYWQTVWFRLLVLVTAVVAVAWIARSIINRRWRNRMAEVERQAALDRERTRIARDMHDELGASLTQIAITSQLAQLDPPEASPGHIAEMASIARRAVTSLDEIVWAVNPRNDTLRSLVEYMGQHAVDFLGTAGLECELSLPDEVPDRAVSAEYRHHLFLAVKETLTNIVKHAGASRVELSVKLAAQGLDLEIADNGRGFEAATSQAGADGLVNIKERIRELHGTCRIHSAPGEGTKVILQLPWPQGVSDE